MGKKHGQRNPLAPHSWPPGIGDAVLHKDIRDLQPVTIVPAGSPGDYPIIVLQSNVNSSSTCVTKAKVSPSELCGDTSAVETDEIVPACTTASPGTQLSVSSASSSQQLVSPYMSGALGRIGKPVVTSFRSTYSNAIGEANVSMDGNVSDEDILCVRPRRFFRALLGCFGSCGKV